MGSLPPPDDITGPAAGPRAEECLFTALRAAAADVGREGGNPCRKWRQSVGLAGCPGLRRSDWPPAHLPSPPTSGAPPSPVTPTLISTETPKPSKFSGLVCGGGVCGEMPGWEHTVQQGRLKQTHTHRWTHTLTHTDTCGRAHVYALWKQDAESSSRNRSLSRREEAGFGDGCGRGPAQFGPA